LNISFFLGLVLINTAEVNKRLFRIFGYLSCSDLSIDSQAALTKSCLLLLRGFVFNENLLYFVCFTALAARCLEVVTIHIPVFKAHFEQRLPPKQYVLLSQFDQILKVNNM